jgi:broad specificity phosphatase PhoE
MKISHFLFSILIFSFLACNSQVEAQTKTIFLVRHAEKADDGSRDPDLSETGKVRAENLATILSTAKVDFVYSTDYKRTRQTGLPSAKQIGKEIITYDPRDNSTLDKIIEESGNSRILIVGHSNTIPGLVNQLIDDERYEQLDEMEYDKLFIVTISGDESDCVVITF